MIVLLPSHEVETTDFDLLHRWKAGDQRAGDELVRRHYESVRRFFDVRVPRASEDLTQRTFLACTESLDRQRPSSFRAYLFGIARNQMLMHLRSESRLDAMRFFDDDAEPAPAATSLTGIFARCEEHHYLLRAIVQLPTELQITVQLYYWEGLPTAEIGEATETNPSTVTTRLARARTLLGQYLEQMRIPDRVRISVVSNLEDWTRSLTRAR